MKIQLKQGIDPLRFGMTRLEVERIFGKPCREFMDPKDEDRLFWEYTEKKLTLTFYQSEADRLGYIRSSHSSLRWNDLKIIDQKIEDIKCQIDSNSESWEKDVYDSFCTFFHEKNWLTLFVEYERVVNIELGVPFCRDDEYDWPK